ncbi:signal transducing adapter molecule 2 [Toxorhynchites rutilus septentrionalis]|uniref:signal transducing adapter molecule 2 n=1 Tax=Toxorhynchites rutilus septentrionalis TaxID=329112 RepID=UPI00247914A2|nr:signal transducing adapter molecule 2 [Toxorhynchites rutilus septentrionalis]
MGILGFDQSTLMAEIEKATSENNSQEKWGLIMEVCDKVTNGTASPKECLKGIVKRLNHSDPHVVMQAITLLDACVSNCGKQFHLEVASRDFETEFKKLLQKSQQKTSTVTIPTKVNTRLKLCLKKWAEAEFKSDPQLNLIPSLYQKLRSEGHDFSDPSVTPKREIPLSKDPNVVSSQQEEEDIAKAIELSLKESKSSTQSPKMGSGGGAAASSLYPTALLSSVPAVESRKVRALYDFEAAEDNELTFQAGEIIMVLDDSDPNWWKGQNQRGEGLFPSNFVTSDLSAEPEDSASSSGGKSKKNVQFSDDHKKDDEKAADEAQVAEINEEKIDRLLHLLHEADPEDPSTDTDEMLQLEQLVNQMGPLIDTELERVDRKHAQLTQLSGDLVDAINLYHTLMREPDRSMMAGPSGYGMQGFPPQPHMPGMYNMPGMFNQNIPGMYANMDGMPGSLPPYGMPQLRHDMGQMSVSSIPQFPPPQQAVPSLSQSGAFSLPPHQIPMNAPGGAAGTHVLGPQIAAQPPMHPQMHPPQPSTTQHQSQQPSQTMPNMPIPSQLTGPGHPHQHPHPPSAAPHALMAMGHMQSPLQQNFPNPTSPPPVVSSAPSSLPHQHQQQQPPSSAAAPTHSQSQQQQAPQPIPQAPAGSFPNYAPPQQGPPNNHTTSQHQQTATAPPPNSMNHHHAQMPLPPFQGSPLPPYLQMPSGVGPVGGVFPPISTAHHHHHMLGMMPPGGPLSINTAGNSPQNIPIYQQQR